MHPTHVPQCTAQNREVRMPVTNVTWWDMGQAHHETRETDHLSVQKNMYYGWGWEMKWLFLHMAVSLNHEQTRSALQKEGCINLLNLVT